MSYLWKRLALAPVLLFCVSFLTFWSQRLIGSNKDIVTGILNTNYTPENAARLAKDLELDKPFFRQFFSWLWKVLHLNFGNSYYSRSGVWGILKDAFPLSIQLVVMAVVLTLLIAVPMAIVAAYRPGSRLDRALSMISFGSLSLPGFVVGIVFLFLFAVILHWFPAGTSPRITEDFFGSFYHLFIPALAIAVGQIAVYQRALRTDMTQTLQEDFITLAKSKGLKDRYILWRHALRPSSFTIVTLSGVSLGALIGNSLIIENLFTIPGLGRTVAVGLLSRDFPIVLGGVVLITFVFILTTTLVDLSYGIIDPRVRHARALA